MKAKSSILLIVFTTFLISCDLNTKFDNPYDRNSDAYILDSDSDSDRTDTDDSDKPDNDSTDPATDYETDTVSDNDEDTKPDNEPDEDEDPVADEDVDTDTISADPCTPNPCSGVANSTGICTVISATAYACGCVSGYHWWKIEAGCTDNLTLCNICTGQDKCYNASSVMEECPASGEDFFGQDAQYTSKCVAQNFTVGIGAQEGTVIDNNTGLVWEQSPSEGVYTWDDAPNHCADLNSTNYGGIKTWRVPNPMELLTIVDNSKYALATNSNFTNMPARLWTSKESKGNTSYAYAFLPYYGNYQVSASGDEYLKTKTYRVLCVSGDEMQPATSAYFTTQTISEKVVVTDSVTGLMWQKDYVTGKTWQQALKYCEDLTYAGYSDWRLPNKHELTSLLNYEKSGYPYSYFPDMQGNWFWSSSTYVYTMYGAWGVSFNTGYVSSSNKANSNNVRCVRSPNSLGNICTGHDKCCNNEGEEITCPTSSSEDFFGQDAQYTSKCSPQSFTLGTGAQEGTVIDNNTGLVWEQSPSENEYTWDDAPNHCAELNSSNFAAINTWRVPNPLEFLTIVDNRRYNPATNSNFKNMPTGYRARLWTSKEYKGNTSYAYVYLVYYGYCYGASSEKQLKTKTYQVLCVSGNEMLPATSADFTTQTISGKVVVIDSKTGLMWQKEYTMDKTWQDALKYCETLTYAGYSDWRLPNKNELASLGNYEKSEKPYSYFPDMPDTWFWSSSTDVYGGKYAWLLDGGVVYSSDKTEMHYVICVR